MRTALPASRIVATVFLPFALGYFLSYLYRNVNAVIAQDLTEATGLSVASLGVLTSAYFLTFASIQIPLGVLLDRYGPRRVEAALLLFAAAGAAIFAMGDDLGTLTVGRALIGLGVSACLMAALKANVMWWPKERLPLVNGLFMAFGGAGAVVATRPVQMILEFTDWRGVFWGLAAITVFAAALIFLVVPDAPRRDGAASGWKDQFRGVAKIYRSAIFWRIAPVSFLVQGAFLAYIGLWAAAWMRQVAGLSEVAVQNGMMGLALAQVVGFLTMGAIADRLTRYGVAPLTVAIVSMGLHILASLFLILELGPAVALWPIYGFLSTGAVLTYAILSQAFDRELAGRVNTALNLLVFVAAFLLQSVIGSAIDRLLTLGFSMAAGHKATLGAVAALQALTLIWLALPRRADAPSASLTAPASGESR